MKILVLWSVISVRMLVERFEGPEKLLVQALLSGIHGVHRALEVFRKQQRANSGTSLDHFIQGFCKDEVTSAPGPEKGPLFTKPLVCLFPRLFQQNLLEFVYHLHHVLPQSTLRHLLDCIKQDCPPNSWVSSLVTQLERQLGIDQEKPLFSAQCGQRLTKLIHQLPRSDEAGGWASCFNLPLSSAPHSGPALPGVVSQRKRKSSDIYQDLDSEETSQNKRMRGNISVLQLKDLIESNSEVRGNAYKTDHIFETSRVLVLCYNPCVFLQWDQSSSDVVKVLNDCDPAQLEVVCSTINLPKIPEHILPKLCSSVLALSPDLSFSTATTFIRNLLLEKILSLSEPASRCLVTTVTSLCSRYPRPMCHALFEHVLEDRNIGNLQADLLNKLVESCLDSHYKLQTLQMTFKVQWNEAVLSIIHCLLDSKLDISEELFTQFTEQLMSQASAFTKSVKFAKMLLTVLTKYNSSITATHKHTLSNCLMLNDTFLKKSLQAALKRITHT
uniref:Fanconi Anaemia group E protein C-terminal domain-containing protein n=1 Tax=Periophthalmus magnuspinnatus TaxID=409849 RepID=A0A3B4BM35_9GOBI